MSIPELAVNDQCLLVVLDGLAGLAQIGVAATQTDQVSALTLSVTETLNARGKLIAVSAAKRKHKRVVVIARKRVTLSGGQTKKVSLSPNRTGKRLLATHHNKLAVRLKVLQSGRQIFTRKLTLKVKPKRKKHAIDVLL